MTIKAQLKWMDGLQFVARVGTGPGVLLDSSDGGSGIKAKAVEQAIGLSETKYCSAMASLNAEFEHSYRIIE